MPNRRLLSLFVAAIAALHLSVSAADGPAERYWPQWRGPHGTGVAPHADPPTEWSETQNVRWKIEIPGRGSSSPVIWGDRVFVTTAVPAGVEGAAAHEPRGGVRPAAAHRYIVLAINRKDGSIAWQRTVREEPPHEGSHADFGTWASPSATTDGEHVIVSFESRGLYAFDMQGKPVWDKDLGDKRMRMEFGEGSSPALYKDTLVVVWDHQGESFIVALDKRTGAEKWKARRDEIDSWATPLVVPNDGGGAQVVTSGMKRVRSYDLATGELLWETEGLTMNPIPSPVAGDGFVFLTSGFRGNKLKAIRLAGAKGDITGTPAIAWTMDRDTPYVPSPLLYQGILYFLKGNTGVLTAVDAASGKPHYALQRLDAAPAVFASPVAGAGRVYVTGQQGTTVVLKHGPSFEVIATNTLDDALFNASPALADKELFLRGKRFLYSIGGGQ